MNRKLIIRKFKTVVEFKKQEEKNSFLREAVERVSLKNNFLTGLIFLTKKDCEVTSQVKIAVLIINKVITKDDAVEVLFFLSDNKKRINTFLYKYIKKNMLKTVRTPSLVNNLNGHGKVFKKAV